jgi:FKBP-type peptidyl-prolyl cis-trans isomerase
MRKFPFALLAAFAVIGCAPTPEAATTDPAVTTPAESPVEATQTSAPEIKQADKEPAKMPKITDTKVGTGAAAAKGDKVYMMYKGTIPKTNEEFDSNYAPERDVFSLTLGQGSVIKGWELGIPGMKVGGIRQLEIPSELAYGEAGSPPKIAPNQDLNFEVKLMFIIKPGEEDTYDAKDLKVGSGRAVKKGDRISVHYTGKFLNGKVFDSSIPRKEAFEFTVGAGEVISGWDEGVVDMKIGGKRRLILPPNLAYGPGGNGTIPPDSVLDFDIELLKILN